MTNPFGVVMTMTAPLTTGEILRQNSPYTPAEKAADIALGEISKNFCEAVYKINGDVIPIKIMYSPQLKAYTVDWVGNYLEDKHLTYILNQIIALKLLSREQINLLQEAELLDPVVWHYVSTDSKHLQQLNVKQLKSMTPWMDDDQRDKIQEIYNNRRFKKTTNPKHSLKIKHATTTQRRKRTKHPSKAAAPAAPPAIAVPGTGPGPTSTHT